LFLSALALTAAVSRLLSSAFYLAALAAEPWDISVPTSDNSKVVPYCAFITPPALWT
jgi:hypothetical protein